MVNSSRRLVPVLLLVPLLTLFASRAWAGAPKAYDQVVNVGAGATVEIRLKGSDPDGDDLQFFLVSSPSLGALGTLNKFSGRVDYTAPLQDAIDTFEFRVEDQSASSAPATVMLIIGDGGSESITVAPTSVTVPAVEGENAPPIEFLVKSNFDEPVDYRAVAGPAWLQANPDSGTATSSWSLHTVTFTTAAKRAGIYRTTIDITDPTGNVVFQQIHLKLDIRECEFGEILLDSFKTKDSSNIVAFEVETFVAKGSGFTDETALVLHDTRFNETWVYTCPDFRSCIISEDGSRYEFRAKVPKASHYCVRMRDCPGDTATEVCGLVLTPQAGSAPVWTRRLVVSKSDGDPVLDWTGGPGLVLRAPYAAGLYGILSEENAPSGFRDEGHGYRDLYFYRVE